MSQPTAEITTWNPPARFENDFIRTSVPVGTWVQQMYLPGEGVVIGTTALDELIVWMNGRVVTAHRCNFYRSPRTLIARRSTR